MVRVENAASKIYVGNLGDYGDKAELERAFSKYGEVISVWVARRPTGFAFVEMKEEDEAEDAVKSLDGREICGQRVRVEMRKSHRRVGNADDRGGRSRHGRDRSRDRSRSRSRDRGGRRDRRGSSPRRRKSRSDSRSPPPRRSPRRSPRYSRSRSRSR
ncbi:unnamed protein product [Oikopleura dioica]|nr:unnamed protein product [Oikopleura dioica]CBY38254.1 unnamed protein product [Oikopleura dioica]